VREISIALPDGRSLTVHDGGDPAGRPVLFHHGTPGSGSPSEGHRRAAEAQGVRLLAYDRAGYAGSSRRPGRSVADVAADVEALADALGLERLATWGISGGGPHALACAALLPDRIAAAASVAGVAPYGAAGLDWLGGMGESNVAEFEAALAGEEALRPLLEAEAAGLGALTAPELVDALATILSDPDVEVLSGELAEWLLANFARALSAGVDGWLDDDLAFAKPWGFDPAAIAVPTLVVHGLLDVMAPPPHSRWLAARIPGVEARFQPDDGHLTLYTERAVHRVHEWLLERP
jgi:pimeloyl-ACP methyl ester carboxylesterase